VGALPHAKLKIAKNPAVLLPACGQLPFVLVLKQQVNSVRLN